MYEFLLEYSDIHALTTLYSSLLIGVTLKLLWAWNIEFAFLDSLTEPRDTKISHPSSFLKKNNHQKGNFILQWIMKYIRRNIYSHDDGEDSFSSPIRS